VVPAREVMSDVEGNDRFRVSLTREQIERFPAYDENELSDAERWSDYEQRYTASRDLKEGPVLHREGSTHTITPQPEEMPAGDSDIRVSSPRRMAMDQPRFGATSDSADAAHTAQLGVGPQTAERRDAGRWETQPLPPEDRRKRDLEQLVTSDNIQPGKRSRTSEERYERFKERLRKEREEILRRRRAA
jgi:hypothetical protein